MSRVWLTVAALLVCLACDHATPVQPVPPPSPPSAPSPPPAPAPPPPPSPALVQILSPSSDTAAFVGDSLAFAFRIQDSSGHEITAPFILSLGDSSVLKAVPSSSAQLFWIHGANAGLTFAKISAGNVRDSVRIAVAEHSQPLADYDVIDLGTLGGNSALPLALNDQDQVVGRSLTGGTGTSHAFLWEDGTMRDLAQDLHAEATAIANSGALGLATIPGPDNAGRTLYAIRNDIRTMVGGGYEGEITAAGEGGEIVGWEFDGERERSFIWRDGQKQYLGGLFLTNVSSPYAMNALDDIVGSAMAGERAGSEIPHAFIWDGAAIRDLGLLGDFPCDRRDTPPVQSCGFSAAYGINRAGAVVGVSSDTSGYAHAVLWTDGVIHDLGQGRAMAINDAGDIVGYADLRQWVVSPSTGGSDATFWRGGVSTPLGSLGGGGTIVAGLNPTGLVAGSSLSPRGARHVFVWDPQRHMTDLGTGAVTTAAAGAYAVAINARGDVLGFSYSAECDFFARWCFGAGGAPVPTRAILWRRKG